MGLEEAVKALEKAEEAQDKGQCDLADLWNQSAKQHQFLAANYNNLAEAMLANNKEEVNRWEEVAEESACQLGEATEALEKAKEAEEKGQNNLADLWRQCVNHHLLSEVNYSKLAEAILAHNEEEATRWYKVAQANESSAVKLKETVKALEKAEEAQEKGENDLANLWRKCANKYKLAAANYEKQVAAILVNNEEENTHWERAAEANEIEADKLEKGAEKLMQ